MKKFWLLSLFLLGLFLYWCWNETTTYKDDIFDKDLKCQEYIDYYTDTFYETYLDDDSPRVWKPRWITLRDTEDYVLVKNPHVFYSPITNSCIWTFWIAEWITDDNWEHYYWYTYRIDSIFWYEHARFYSEPYSTCRSEFKWSKYSEEYNELCKTKTISEIENERLWEIDWLKWN